MAKPQQRRHQGVTWVDDRIIDVYGPKFGEKSYGAAVLAVYVVLARHAGSDAEAWPGLRRIAALAATSVSTVKRSLAYLEELGLIRVAVTYENAGRQTSHTYTLLEVPDRCIADKITCTPGLEVKADNVREVIRVVGGGGARRRVGEDPRSDRTGGPFHQNGGGDQRERGTRSGRTAIEGRNTEGQTKKVRATGYQRLRATCVAAAARDETRPPGVAIEDWADRLQAAGRCGKLVPEYTL